MMKLKTNKTYIKEPNQKLKIKRIRTKVKMSITKRVEQ
jgi:hypothetical protein